MLRLSRRLLRDRRGQGLTEYALLVGAVATLIVASALLFRGDLSTALAAVGSHLQEKAGEVNNGRSGHAPGHGGTPPGQGGTPPGQVGR